MGQCWAQKSAELSGTVNSCIFFSSGFWDYRFRMFNNLLTNLEQPNLHLQTLEDVYIEQGNTRAKSSTYLSIKHSFSKITINLNQSEGFNAKH